jgi:UDP-2-acetamido-2-deoxy-ribo-hexuluronate aminotransferase
MNFIDLKAQYHSYKEEINLAISEVLENTAFIGGKALVDLEAGLATYTGSKNAIGCASGTDALFIVLRALDIGPGDEVITTPFTFFASAASVSLTGAKPVFVDIDPKTYNIDPTKIEKAITAKTKAIIPVSL